MQINNFVCNFFNLLQQLQQLCLPILWLCLQNIKTNISFPFYPRIDVNNIQTIMMFRKTLLTAKLFKNLNFGKYELLRMVKLVIFE